jgi:hypothetical protein
MKLNTIERILLLRLLPKEGDITMLRIQRDLTRDLSFTEEENARIGFKIDKNEDGQFIQTWDPAEGAKEVDVVIGPKAHCMIEDSLKELNKAKKLEAGHISLFEKFVEAEK